ncbi:aminoacyl-tRNA hydrolase, partial [Clostridioides difficile]|nr:aminoacyl-tRNA hydrolase [Clostridioides difficile]
MLYGKIMTIRFERREVLMKIIVGLGNPGKPY